MGNNGNGKSYYQILEENKGLVVSRYSNDRRVNRVLASGLEVPYTALVNKASEWGITRRRRYKKWSTRDNEIILDMASRFSVPYIANYFKVTETAVRDKIRILGSRCRFKDGWYSARDLVYIFGVTDGKIKKWIDDGLLKATRHCNKDLKGKRHVEEKDVKAFIRRYPYELCGRNVDLVQIVEILAGVDYTPIGKRNGKD